MARRVSKLDDLTRERIRARLAIGESKQAIARELGVSLAAVKAIENEAPDKLQALRDAKTQEFIAIAHEEIRQAMKLGSMKVALATAGMGDFGKVLDDFTRALKNNKGTKPKDVVDATKALGRVIDIPLNHIATYIGVLYDKSALASGNATERSEVVTKDDMEKMSDDDLQLYLEKLIAQAGETIASTKKPDTPAAKGRQKAEVVATTEESSGPEGSNFIQ